MNKIYLLLLLCGLSLPCFAKTTGEKGVENLKQCIMQNDSEICHSYLTPNSYPLFDRFVSYNLMPCLPTDFSYGSEQKQGNITTVKALLPAGGGVIHHFRLVFNGDALDIPQTFRVGFGENWENKINLSEQIFLMMRQNMQQKLTCDILRDLAQPMRK